MRMLDASGWTPAQVQLATDEVTMVIDEVREIANRTMHALATDADQDRAAFAQAPTDPAMFGEAPLARALGRHHRAAHQVFVDTLQGVLEDLESFRDNLKACADTQEATDESVQAGLLALGRRYDHRAFASDRANEASRVRHSEALQASAQERESTPVADAEPAGGSRAVS